MKTKLTLLAITFFFILSGCNKTEVQSNNQPVEGKIINQTGCKDFTAKSNAYENDESCILYEYDESNNKLIIKHINAGFNCCPEELSCSVTQRNDTLVIEEFESDALCACNCLFDIDIELSEIEPGEYYIQFTEPYCGDQEKLEFTINLDQFSTGEYCVERTQYPWGI